MKNNKRDLVNYRIKSKFIYLIDETGRNLGKYNAYDAVKKAERVGLDLVQVNHDQTPTCKIMDYGKYKYNLSKKDHNKTNNQVKKMRIGLNIADHDLSVKNRKVTSFLEKKMKVEYMLQLRGRERNNTDAAKELMEKALKDFEGIATWDRVSVSGSILRTTITPK